MLSNSSLQHYEVTLLLVAFKNLHFFFSLYFCIQKGIPFIKLIQYYKIIIEGL